MSQAKKILSHLKHRPITAFQALDRYGCLRLAARISDLRRKGHQISTEIIDLRGKRIARYRLSA